MDRLRRCLAPFVTRRSVARIFSTFLCALVIAIRPFSRLGGPNAFLVLTIKELVFSVQRDQALQLEATILNIMGALLGIGWSALGIFLSSLRPYDSASARAIPAAFLIILVFVAGWLKSRLPRLSLSTRISMFVSIFMLTTDISVHGRALVDAGHFLWISLSAAVLTLISSVLLLPWSSAQFAEDIASSFAGLRECLFASLNGVFGDTPPSQTFDYKAAQAQLLRKSVTLNANYYQISFELRVGRLSIKSIRQLIGIVEYLRRELAWGMSFTPLHSSDPIQPDSKIHMAFREPAQDLGNALVTAMDVVEQSVLLAYQHSSLIVSAHVYDKGAIEVARRDLNHAQDAMRKRLRSITDDIDVQQRMSCESEVALTRELFDLCLLMVSLLQMAHEMHYALKVAHSITSLFESRRTRLWLPRISLAWLGVAPNEYVYSDPFAPVTELDENEPAETALSAAEARQGIYEATQKTTGIHGRMHSYTDTAPAREWTISPRKLIHRAWTARGVMRARFFMSKFTGAIKHSPHVKHAVKNATGIAILGFYAFFPNDSVGSRWFKSVHGQWMLISFMWILETNTGATWRAGYLRLSGTIIGAIYAYVTVIICGKNPYGLVTLITFSDVFISWVILHTTFPMFGTVAGITLPPIAFTAFVNPTSTTPVITLAVDRGLMIGAGIIVALLMNSLIWPRHCRVLFLTSTSSTLSLLSEYYMSLSRDMFQTVHSFTPGERRRNLKLELQIRGALHRQSLLVGTMADEVSLMPKPIRHYKHTVATMQRILDLLTGLRKVRENIPRKETVASVFKERREMMSCICLSLYACEHAFRARQPLPQFIPSTRHAFNNLETHVEECIREVREENPRAMGLSLVYAFAESEALRDLVEALETLVDLTRELFGTAAWLTHPTVQQHHAGSEMSSMCESEEPLGWYSTFKPEEGRSARSSLETNIHHIPDR